MSRRGEIRGAVGGRSALGILIALAFPIFASPKSAAAPSTTPPPATKSTKQSPMPGSLGRVQKPAPVYAKAQYDSQLSVNDRCPVRHGSLNPRIRPVYVNRQPVGFC